MLPIFISALMASAETGGTSFAQVFPSGPILSAHTLRLSVRFTKVPSGEVLPRLALRSESEGLLRDPFVQQELWSPDRKTLTLLFDPGRLKSGIGRHNDLGAPLEGLTGIALLLDNAVLRYWQVDRRPCRPIDPSSWTIQSPRPGTYEPLQISFPEAVDIQSEHLVAIVAAGGRRVKGTEVLTASESVWRFTPVARWTRGDYWISLHSNFENACGDEFGDSFEHAPHTGPLALTFH